MTYDELVARFHEAFEVLAWDDSIPYSSAGWLEICRLSGDIDAAEANRADMSAPEPMALLRARDPLAEFFAAIPANFAVTIDNRGGAIESED